jgi:hypothetical membrane protein
MRWYRSPGLMMFIASTQLIIFLMLAEATYPGYSISENYISDLGVGPSPAYWIFNISVFIFGLLAIYSAYLVDTLFGKRLNAVLLAIAGIGAVGVGLFHEDLGAIHVLMAFLAFFFGGLSAIFTFKIVKGPFALLSFALGTISIIALILQGAGAYMGIGVGGMERMIFYPVMLWAAVFGGYLMGNEDGLVE